MAFPAYAQKHTETPTETPTPSTPTPVLTATATPTATPIFNPAATPVAGGSIRVISVSDVQGVAGDAVDAGEFEIVNTTDSTESVSAIRLELSEAAVFSELTLTASGQSASVGSPSSENEFFFDSPLEILPASSIRLILTGTIGSATSSATATPSTSSSPTAAVPTSTPTSDLGVTGFLGRGPVNPSSPLGDDGKNRETDVLAIGLALVALCAAILGSVNRRRRGLAVLSLVLLGIALYAGCGSEQTSEQTVTGLTVAIPTGPASMTGVPASLGTVSRPLPLVFPGG